ncbi:glycosyltransferase involved in cell wall biosynthesis [Mycetocola sp. CAN_C7]
MIGISSRVSARFVDFFVRRSLTAAARVLYLTEDERQSLEAISNYGASLTLLLNGVPQTEAMPAPSVPEVLFLARLQERKRPVAFVEMARTLLDDGAKATFTLVGPDEGEGDAVRLAIRASGHSKSIVWEGSLPPADTLGRMSSASIYVLPSVNEIVPMSVLEAMSLARAVVITDSNGLAPIVRAAHAGVVVDTSQESLVDGVRQLLSSPQLAAQLAHNAHELITRDFSIESIARVLEEIYLQSIEPKSR